jgi:hypothetical protein
MKRLDDDEVPDETPTADEEEHGVLGDLDDDLDEGTDDDDLPGDGGA